MDNEELFKQSLLLTHGTIYGTVGGPVGPWVDFASLSASFNKQAGVSAWMDALFYKGDPEVDLTGALTDNLPIDVVSWQNTGRLDHTGLEWWQQCMTLFMRHI